MSDDGDGVRAARAAVGAAVAAERVRIVAALIRVTGDWDLAEDCVQDAIERALERWPADGVPANPSAWLTTAARHRAIDVLRRRQTERAKLREAQALAELERDVTADDPGPYGDDRLTLLFTCCHPALPLAGRVALTLKVVGGLSTRQIARSFLVSEATMGQRLLRTKTRIEQAGIAFRVPEPHRLAERTAAVLAVVYLIFTEGYATLHDDLAAEAIQLAGLLTRLLPDDDEVLGLHALLLLQHARRAARTDAAGELVTLEDQDRGRWDHHSIDAGLTVLAAARATGRPPGYYRLQAEIAALHSTAVHPDLTDWGRIVAGYDALLVLRPSPAIALNRAVAVGLRDGPEVGLLAVEGLADHPLLPAVRADLLRRAGRRREAATAYREAAAVARTEPERRLLERRLREVTEP